MERAEAAGKSSGLTERPSPVEPTDASPLCSVVIPTYNGRELLERCLASIARHRPADGNRSIEVVVSDDGSTDGTAEWLAARVSRCPPGPRRAEPRVLRGRQRGESRWRRAGSSSCSITIRRSDPAGSRRDWPHSPTRASGPSLRWSWSDRSQVAWTRPATRTRYVGWPTKRGHGQPAPRFAARPVEEVFGASGSSAFYRAEALRIAGGFDPLFGSYYEDTDLAFRLRWAGYRCLFAPGCLIYHDVSATYDHKSPGLQRRMARNAELVFWANLPAGLLALAIVPHLCS